MARAHALSALYGRPIAEFRWNPDTYSELMREQVPDYEQLQAEAVAATRALAAHSILDLGTGTGETASRVLAAHPGASLEGIDSSAEMLAAARPKLAGREVRLHVRRIQDELPAGPFELVTSALAVHHLDGPEKAALFHRIAGVLVPGGRFVLADLMTPRDRSEQVTPINDPDYDKPSSVEEQLEWLGQAGLRAHVHWRHRDLAVLVGFS